MTDLNTLLNQGSRISNRDGDTIITYKTYDFELTTNGFSLSFDIELEGINSFLNTPYRGGTNTQINIQFSEIKTYYDTKLMGVGQENSINFFTQSHRLPYTSMYFLEISLNEPITITLYHRDDYSSLSNRTETAKIKSFRIYFSNSINADWARQQLEKYL